MSAAALVIVALAGLVILGVAIELFERREAQRHRTREERERDRELRRELDRQP